jgi:hypothetical protein
VRYARHTSSNFLDPKPRLLERGQVRSRGFVARLLGELWKNEKNNTRVGDKNER